MSQTPSTEPYKGVRDFYPEDMAVQRYIFDTWAKTAESFGFERYDASVLEPSDLYKAKGVENEEMVNEQTYTFVDRGDREVTLRPEMTPTVARMVAGKRRELAFPLRWYSIPNLFRYERTQRGRLREHWQLNVDIFGTHDQNADVEIILLASEILKAFGAQESDFDIHVNDRKTLFAEIESKLKDKEKVSDALHLLDSKAKMSAGEYKAKEAELFSLPIVTDAGGNEAMTKMLDTLKALGVTNAVYDPTIVRGFTYYTGTVFEVFDTNPDNRRSLLGGGRYDNLTALFGGDPIPAVGFGMGDVTMRDFLETHDLMKLMPNSYRNASVIDIVTSDVSYIPYAQDIAQKLRAKGINTSVNLTDKKMGDQIKHAVKSRAQFILPIGEDEKSGTFKLKRLADSAEFPATIETIASFVS